MTKEERFKQIVEPNKNKILGICRRYAACTEDQNDIFQEILINIWRSLETFKGNSNVDTWVYRISVNTSLTFCGKQYKKMRLNVDLNKVNLESLTTFEENEKIIEEEKISELQALLNQLNVIDKAIMGLVLEGLSTKDIADIIGITEPNVRVKIHRVKEILREKMKGGIYGKQ